MPRKQRCRRIACFPDYWTFTSPEGECADEIVLTIDEFETIRLIDYEGMTQEQCSQKMDVARTTVTDIYNNARNKLSAMLVEGRPLRIFGGSYRLDEELIADVNEKGSGVMRIAVTYENGEIFQHFGHTEQFKLYDVEDGKIVAEQIMDTDGNGHGALAGLLKVAGVDALICGGIGMGAVNALAHAGIRLYGQVTGNADAAVAALLEGRLDYSGEANCDHHGHEHACGTDEGNKEGCGGHACGEHEKEHECGHGEGCRSN